MSNTEKMVEKGLIIAAGIMVVILAGIVCYKMGESAHSANNVLQNEEFNKGHDEIRRLEVNPTVQFTVNVKSEDLKSILNNTSKEVATNDDVKIFAESDSVVSEVSTNIAQASDLELAKAEQEKRYNETMDLFRRYAYTMDLWQNRNRSDGQNSADDKMYMLINGDGEYEIKLFEFTMEGAVIKTAYEFGQADVSKDVSDMLTSMVAKKNALILAQRKIYFWKFKRENSVDCSVPVTSERLNPAAEELGALYEFMKEARRLPLLYQVSFKAEDDDKIININTFPFGETINRSVFEQRVKRYLSDCAIAAEKERLKKEYAEKAKGLNKRRVVFGNDKKIITRLDGTIEVPRKFFWDGNRGWGRRLGTWEKGQEKEQQRYERWVQLVDEANRQEAIVKELKSLDRNINRDVLYMRVDRLDVEDMLNRGKVIIKSVLKK